MLRFVDVSNNNGPNVDFAKLKADGAVGVYLKVTEGTTFVDADYVSNYNRAKAAGLKVGSYHYGHPKNNSVEELNFFLAHLKLEKGDLLPALDLEVTDGSISSRVNAYGLSFLGGLKAKFGVKPVLYSGENFMKANGLLDAPALKWVADYGAHPDIHYDAWQYTDGQAKYGAPIDGFDTSFVPVFGLFVYGVSRRHKVVTHVKKHVKRAKRRAQIITCYGLVMLKGSPEWKWFEKNKARILGLLGRKKKS